MNLAEHLALHGGPPPLSRRGRREQPPLIGQIEEAGLHGQGGAGFPTAVKMRAVAASRGRPVVLVNAAEGEPASLKDRTLMQTVPHLVLDGAILAAEALGADEVIVGVCESARASVSSVAEAIAQRGAPRRRSARTRLVGVPAHYLAGQESALVNHVNGATAIPSFTPPMVFQRGVARRPTLVNNAETLAQLALIARHGPSWFRELGTASQPGSTLLTLSGPVAHPGVYEIAYGTSLQSLIAAAGGATAPSRAVLLGGYGGCWVAGEHLANLVLCDEHLSAHGASLGAGVVALLPAEACPVAETARLARWLADRSAGQCGPCVHGLHALAAAVKEIAAGGAQRGCEQRIERLTALVRGRGACGHPDGAARMISSAMLAFGGEFADHARHGPCDGCRDPAFLALPRSSDNFAEHGRSTAGKPVRPR
jgi:NADH:ubiquinone oxidoreductase subunit F (NADH-binding)